MYERSKARCYTLEAVAEALRRIAPFSPLNFAAWAERIYMSIHRHNPGSARNYHVRNYAGTVAYYNDIQL